MENERKLMQFYFITEGELSTHYHQNLELFYVLKGNLEVRIDDTCFRLGQGDIIAINANKRHTMNGQEGLLGARFEIDFRLLAEELGTMQLLFWCNTVADRNEAYEDLRRILDCILERHFERQQKGALHLNALYYEALHILTSNFMVRSDDARLQVEDSQDRIRVQQIQNYIQANYQSQISLNDLAERLYLSNAYLSKYVKRHMGLTFMEYLNNVRLFYAVDELLYTKKNMTRIALDNGFPTSAAFTKAFRDIYGEAPSAYRKRVQKEMEPKQPSAELSEAEQRKILEYLRFREEKGLPEPDREHVCEADAVCYQKMEHVASRAVNVGDAYLILQSEVQNQLKEIRKNTGLCYVRIWNLLSRENCFDGQKGYNFRKLDLVLDFLLENQMKPYLVLGQKPILFMYTPERSVREMEATETYSLETFSGIIKALSKHLVNRYGVEELESWYFEYWYDHNNLTRRRSQEKDSRRVEYWDDLQGEIDREDWEFFEYFETLYRMLKAISPDIRVGGAEFILGFETLWCREVFQIWKKRSIWPDFLSFCSYQYIAIYEDGKRYGRKSIDGSYIRNQVEIMREVMAETGFSAPEFHIDEWNFTISNRNVLNDSCEQGAYILKNCVDLAGDVDIMAYWHALDVYSDYYDTDLILNGDSGLITRDGIAKPSYYAFTFLNKLLPNVVAKDENVLITTNGKGRFMIACHNYKKLSSQYVSAEEDQIKVEELDQYIEDREPLKLRIKLDHVKNGNYLVRSFYINRENGSVQDIWKRMEYTSHPTQDEMDYLKRSAAPRLERQSIDVEDGVMELENVLLDQEIRLLDIQYRYDSL